MIEEITLAFSNIKRNRGVTLHQAIAEDDWKSQRAIQEARKLDADTRWQDVPKENIAQYPNVFPYFDIEGLRYYLPAYMCWSIENYQSDRWSVAYFTVSAVLYLPTIGASSNTQELSVTEAIHAFVKQHRFTQAQIVAIYHFLAFMGSKDVSDPIDECAVALETWQSLAEAS